jgi:amidase
MPHLWSSAMDPSALSFLSLTDLSARLDNGTVSPVEVTDAILDRIRRLDPTLHSYLAILEERARTRAIEAEREIRAGRRRGPLHGVPIAVKDLCQTSGIATTCASRVLRDWVPKHSATVVQRLEAAGAILVGKLNLTEFAMAWYHPKLTVPQNPWNPALWPGASSSGSGVATAAGLCFGSLGTDTGGSIRFPSAACGIVGLKPSYGRVSRQGVFPLGESLDHIGPMTRTVADAAAMLTVIAGHDPADPTSRRAPVQDYGAVLGRGVKGIRMGIDERYIGNQSAPEVAAAVIDAARTLERLGATLVAVEVPDVEPCISAWTKLCAAEAAATHAATYPSRAAEYGPGFRSFLEVGSALHGADYASAHFIRERFAGDLHGLFGEVDLLLCPSMPSTSLPVADLPPDARGLGEASPLMRFTAPFNMSRNPTLSLPCGPASSGPPPSLQLVARDLDEATLVQVGAAFEQATSWHEQRPIR